MSKHQSGSKAGKKSKLDIEWENRVLCDDGNCIGVIGPDGNCKECGKTYQGKLPWQVESGQFGPGPETSPDSDISDQEEETAVGSDIDNEEMIQDDHDWESRRLCSDGNCIGVIGPDGRCKECGKACGGD